MSELSDEMAAEPARTPSPYETMSMLHQEHCDRQAALRNEIDRLRIALSAAEEKLREAEWKVKHARAFYIGCVEFRFSNNGWEVKNWRTLHYLDVDGTILEKEFTWVHRTLDAAIAAARAAGWDLGEEGAK